MNVNAQFERSSVTLNRPANATFGMNIPMDRHRMANVPKVITSFGLAFFLQAVSPVGLILVCEKAVICVKDIFHPPLICRIIGKAAGAHSKIIGNF